MGTISCDLHALRQGIAGRRCKVDFRHGGLDHYDFCGIRNDVCCIHANRVPGIGVYDNCNIVGHTLAGDMYFTCLLVVGKIIRRFTTDIYFDVIRQLIPFFGGQYRIKVLSLRGLVVGIRAVDPVPFDVHPDSVPVQHQVPIL